MKLDRSKNLDSFLTLKGKLIYITGASSGIGKALVLQLAGLGCKMALTARSVDKLSSLCEFVNANKQEQIAYSFPCDMADAELFHKLLGQIKSEFGTPDIIVNCAGLGGSHPLAEAKFKEIIDPIQVPFTSSMIMTWFFAPLMEKKKSQFVFVTSPVSFIPLPYMLGYTSSRYGMAGMVSALNREYMGSEMIFSLACFGAVRTNYQEKNKADINWYPWFSKLVREIEKEEAAQKIIEMISKRKYRIVHPAFLRFVIFSQQQLPIVFDKLFTKSRLFTPPNKLKK